jgi:cell division septal protein FtsQ
VSGMGGMRGTLTLAPLPAGAGGRGLDFRRRGAPVRRRRRNPLLALVKPLAVALSLVALPLWLASWVLGSRHFQLHEVTVDGGRRVPAEWVRQALAPLSGANLVRLSLAEVAARLEQNPWVAAVEVEKVLPNRLRVELTERRPVALLERAGGLLYADEEGRPIAPVASATEAAEAHRRGLLAVRFVHPVPGGLAGALTVAGELGREKPGWAGALTQIEVLGEDDFRLHTAALPYPLLVTRGAVAAKVRRLEALLPQLASRYPQGVAAVDLRFSRRIVVQPVSSPRPPAAPGPRS